MSATLELTQDLIARNSVTPVDAGCQQVMGDRLAALGFKGTYQKNYTHRDGGRVLDLHFEKDGTDLFKGWKAEECSANLAAIDSLFDKLGIAVTKRVMSMAEAYA